MNHQATGKKAKRGAEMVQRFRALVLNTFDAVEKRGRVLSDILADEFEKNPLKFMEMASKFLPKQLDIEIDPESVRNVINASPEMTVEKWQNQQLSGNHSQDRKPH